MVKKKTIFSEKFVSDNTPSTLQRPAHFSLKFCIYKSLIIDQIEHALAYNNEKRELYFTTGFFNVTWMLELQILFAICIYDVYLLL